MTLSWLDVSASYSHSSLALPAIEACRRGDPYTWCSVKGTINSDIFLLCAELYASKPDIVASTLWLFNHEIVLKVCERLKALQPHTTIILGGPEFNGANEEFLRRNSFVDFVFRGDAEVEFHKFLGGESHENIVGLCYIDSSGHYRDNGKARVSNFATLPPPESSRFFNFDTPFVQIECTRGCFNECAFCVSGGDKPILTKSIEEIEGRIKNIESHGVKDIRILDRTFNYSTARAREMLTLFTKFPSMNFHLEIHPALLSDELCSLLATMPHGLLHLEAGVQSLDEQVIAACGRIGTCKSTREGLAKLCQMSNFETHTDLIAGLPHYSLAQIFSDVRELSKLGAGEIQLELLKLLPGTKMRGDAAQNDIRFAHTPPYEVLETPDITLDELNRARLLSKLLDKFYNAKGWQAATRLMINENSDFLCRFLRHLTQGELLEKPLSLERRGELLYQFCRDEMHGRYTDEISILWIENGMSLRKEVAGDIKKATLLPEGLERQSNVHYYHWQGANKSIIFGFDRSKNHSHPTIKVEL